MHMMLLLLMAIAPGAEGLAPPPVEPWHAFGTERPWTLKMEAGHILFQADGKPPLTVEAVKPKAGDMGWVYAARGLTVETVSMGCEADEKGDRYRDIVSVTVGRESYSGCGGDKLSPEDLFGTSWEIAEIAGGRVGGANYMIDFVGGRFLAYDGCRRVQGRYVQAGGTLAMTPEGATEPNCNAVAWPCARRLWEIVETPATLTFEDRTHVVLRGARGVVRLQAPNEDQMFNPPAPTPCGAGG